MVEGEKNDGAGMSGSNTATAAAALGGWSAIVKRGSPGHEQGKASSPGATAGDEPSRSGAPSSGAPVVGVSGGVIRQPDPPHNPESNGPASKSGNDQMLPRGDKLMRPPVSAEAGRDKVAGPDSSAMMKKETSPSLSRKEGSKGKEAGAVGDAGAAPDVVHRQPAPETEGKMAWKQVPAVRNSEATQAQVLSSIGAAPVSWPTLGDAKNPHLKPQPPPQPVPALAKEPESGPSSKGRKENAGRGSGKSKGGRKGGDGSRGNAEQGSSKHGSSAAAGNNSGNATTSGAGASSSNNSHGASGSSNQGLSNQNNNGQAAGGGGGSHGGARGDGRGGDAMGRGDRGGFDGVRSGGRGRGHKGGRGRGGYSNDGMGGRGSYMGGRYGAGNGGVSGMRGPGGDMHGRGPYMGSGGRGVGAGSAPYPMSGLNQPPMGIAGGIAYYYARPPMYFPPGPYPPNMALPHANPQMQLLANIRQQIEYYFSNDNLVKDIFLRSKMDGGGWIDLGVIAGFNRVRMMAPDPAIIVEALKESHVVEFTKDNKKLRRRQDWQVWLLADASTSGVSSKQQEKIHDPATSQPGANQMGRGDKATNGGEDSVFTMDEEEMANDASMPAVSEDTITDDDADKLMLILSVDPAVQQVRIHPCVFRLTEWFSIIDPVVFPLRRIYLSD